MKPKIIIDENIPYIRGRLEGVANPVYLNQEEITPERIKDADALIVRTRTLCNHALLEDSSVRLVVTATIGTDHIDLDYCQQAGIEVRNCPGCNAPGVAQYVWSSILRNGFRAGKDKLGIVGYGNVGKIVGQWAKLTGTEVLISDPPLSEKASAKGISFLSPEEEPKMREASLEEILKECDAVTLHTPLTKGGAHPTFHLINHENILLLRPGAILVNAARGGVTDTEALKSRSAAKISKNSIKEKKEGNIKNEGDIKLIIDTWEGEPAIDRELLSAAVVATPHIAGYSRQGKERATRMSLEAVNEFFGLEADTSGLAPDYVAPDKLHPETIITSYNPEDDTERLKKNPENFEKLRQDYDYREETSAGKVMEHIDKNGSEMRENRET